METLTIAERHTAKREGAYKRQRVQERILDEVAAERRRQDEIHNETNCSVPTISNNRKLSILIEEVGEVGKECVELGGPPWPAHEQIPAIKARLRTELIQTAAVCVAWLESLEVGS